jgi:rubrerythrin
MYDYVVDKNNKVVRGDKNHKLNVEYEITFVKTSNDDEITKCPSCGAVIEDIITAKKCPYCRHQINVDARKYVMSKKTCINQTKI